MSGPALEARFRVELNRGRERFELDVELELAGGVLVLYGPSGAGKTLTVRALAGLLRPDEGHIRVNGRTLFDAAGGVAVPAHQRRVGYVPQEPSLFPFKDVRGNVTFGLPAAARRGTSAAVLSLLEEVGIAPLAAAQPASLSGGERQRVALARALAARPRLLLLDEPFAALDVAARAELRGVVSAALERHGIPAVVVTHDRADALALADRVSLFEQGRTTRAGGAPEMLG